MLQIVNMSLLSIRGQVDLLFYLAWRAFSRETKSSKEATCPFCELQILVDKMPAQLTFVHWKDSKRSLFSVSLATKQHKWPPSVELLTALSMKLTLFGQFLWTQWPILITRAEIRPRFYSALHQMDSFSFVSMAYPGSIPDNAIIVKSVADILTARN